MLIVRHHQGPGKICEYHKLVNSKSEKCKRKSQSLYKRWGLCNQHRSLVLSGEAMTEAGWHTIEIPEDNEIKNGRLSYDLVK